MSKKPGRPGSAAVEAAVAGTTDKMVAFKCTREGGYQCQTSLEPLDIVANFEKKVPVSGSTRPETAWSSPSSIMYSP